MQYTTFDLLAHCGAICYISVIDKHFQKCDISNKVVNISVLKKLQIASFPALLAPVVLSNKRFIHSSAEKKARTLRSSTGRVRKLDCGIPERDYW